MDVRDAGLAGVKLIGLHRHTDERGWFARAWDVAGAADAGLDPEVHQINLSHTAVAGTVRGMHWQADPHGEPKVVRVLRGAVYDVAVDLRPTSPTRHAWVGHTLSAEDGTAMAIPRGFAHGFQALTDDVLVLYLMGHPYEAPSGRGFRHDDPAVGITWPEPVTHVSGRDAAWPLLQTGGDRSAGHA